MKTFSRHCFYLLVITALDQFKQPSVPVPANALPARDDNMAMGNPDGARPLESSPNAYLITRPTYSLSYN
ncbi:hypothetical protein [Spirosoma areae]